MDRIAQKKLKSTVNSYVFGKPLKKFITFFSAEHSFKGAMKLRLMVHKNLHKTCESFAILSHK